MSDTDRIPARTVGLVDLHNNACSLVGSVLDQGDVVLIGDGPDSPPYAVLMSAALFESQGGSVNIRFENSSDPWKRCSAPGCRCYRDGESPFCVDHEEAEGEPLSGQQPAPSGLFGAAMRESQPEPQPEPIKGAPGLWPCRMMGCPRVVSVGGTFCEEHGGKDNV